MSEPNDRRGIIDAADRLAGEILKAPGFKEKVRLLLNSLDPDSTPELMRTLIWTDPDFFLSLAGAVPEMINALALGGKEILTQLENIPPAMLAGFASGIIDRLDAEALGAMLNRGRDLSRSAEGLAAEPVKESWAKFMVRVRQGPAEAGSGREVKGAEHKEDHSKAAGGDEAAAGPEVIKELLRTPLFKDLLALSLRDAFSGDPLELAKTLLWEDAPFSLGLLGNLPKMIGFLAALLNELGRQLQNVPPEMLREFVSQMIKNLEIPGTAAGEDPQSPEAAGDLKIAFTNMVLDKTDFGAIRHAVAGRARENRPVNENLIRQIASDPIRFANVLNTLPPLINNLLNGLATAMSGLDYPPEIVASAAFNFLGELEQKEMSALVNSTSRLINKLHAGSLVLGRDEPLFRPVLRNLVEGVLENLDAEAAAGALQALFEDGEVVLAVAGEALLQNSALLQQGLPAVLQGLNAQLRGCIYLLNLVNQLPAETFHQLGRILEENIDLREVGHLANALVATAGRLLAENPALLPNSLTRFFHSLDGDAFKALTGELLKQGRAFAEDEGLLDPEPAAAGAAINALLTAFNRKFSRDPQVMQDALNRSLEQVDYDALTAALAETSHLLAGAMEANPQLSRFVTDTLFSIIRAAVKRSLNPRNWSLFSRPAKGKKAEKGGGGSNEDVG